MIKTWQDIPGFFDFMDIYDQAVAEAKEGDELVEVGTFLGKSAAYMALKIQESGKRLQFEVVDSWDETDYANWWTSLDNDPPRPWPVTCLYGMSLYKAFIFCMRAVDARGTVMPIRMRSIEAAAKFKDQSLSFVFIDANHLYAGINADIKAWMPKVKPGGLLGGHDYDVALWPDVKRAVDEEFGPTVEHRGTSWLVRM